MKELIEKKGAPYYYSIRNLEEKTYEEIRAFIQRDFTRHFHIQEFYEIIIITNGVGIHTLDEREYSVKKGAVFIVPPMVKHAFISEYQMDVFHTLIHPKFFEYFTRLLSTLPNYDILFNILPTVSRHGNTPAYLYIPEDEFDGFFENYILPMMKYDHPADIFDLCNAYADTLHLICELCRFSVQVQNDKESSQSGIASALTYINENYNKKIELDDLLKISALSKTAFYQRFRELTGKSPSQYIISVRLASAQNMLRNTLLSVDEIASAIGFYDRAHFVKAYKSEFGISPTQYKKSIKNP
ncbi:MAG: AraC family transcriptional regulator [Clostridia bacterium]|nr:AraC family transcriptional regulator [Clostridia bacterium]